MKTKIFVLAIVCAFAAPISAHEGHHAAQHLAVYEYATSCAADRTFFVPTDEDGNEIRGFRMEYVPKCSGTIILVTNRDTEVAVRIVADEVVQVKISKDVAAKVDVRSFQWRTTVAVNGKKGPEIVSHDCLFPARDGWVLKIGYDDQGLIFRCVFE